MINVQELDAETYQVIVDGETKTTHEVAVDGDYYRKLTNGRISPELLVRRAFEFLLDREENTEILRRFALIDINDFFGDFETEIQKRLD